MDQEAKYWRDKWKEVVRLNIQLKQELFEMQDARRVLEANRETVKRLKEKRKSK